MWNHALEPVKSEKAIQHSINNSVSRSRQMVYNYSLSNEWDWFVTLTFDPKILKWIVTITIPVSMQ